MSGFWTAGETLLVESSGPGCFGSASSCIYMGGYNRAYADDYGTEAEEYDGTAWALISSGLNPTGYGAGFGTSTAGAVCGGLQSYIFGDLTNKTQEYDGTSWSLGGNMIEDLRSHGSAPSGTLSAGLVFGGYHLEGSSGDECVKSATREYNGTYWSSGGALPQILYNCSGIGTQTDALCCGGQKYDAPKGPYDAVYNYDGSSWSAHSTLPEISTGRNGTGTTSGGLFVGSSDALNNTFEFDGTSWLVSGNVTILDRSLAIGVCGSPSGAVLAGGTDSNGYISYCEHWNDATVPIIPVSTGHFDLGTGGDFSAAFRVPKNVEVDDIMFVLCMDADNDTFSAPTGWNLGGSGTNDRNASFAWFWRRVTDIAERYTNVTFNSADDAGALVCVGGLVVRGALASGTPLEQAQSWGTTQGTSATIPGLSTQGDDRLVIAMVGVEDDVSVGDTTYYKKIAEHVTTFGGGGCLAFYAREMPDQGSVGADSCVLGGKDYSGTFTVAVIPEPVIEDFVVAEAGSYSITGSTDTSFKAKLVVDSGSYEYIPTIPATLPCAIGSYVLWGMAVSEEINAEGATYEILGTPAGLDRRRIPIKGKSMIVDVATNWGDTSNTSLWSIDLFLRGEKLVFDNSNMEGDCPDNGLQGEIENAFDMKTIVGSKIIEHSFYTYNDLTALFRFYMNFLDGEIEFDEMIITNMFGAGFSWFDNRGIKDVKMYMSDDYQESLVYEETIPNSRLIFDGQIPKNPSDTVAYPYSVPLGNFMPGNPGSYSLSGTSTALERSIGIDDWEDTWLPGWAYRLLIRVDSSKLPDNVEGTPFRIIIGTTGGLPHPFQDLTHIFDEIGASFLKLAVTDYTGLHQLNVEVTYWNVEERFGILSASRASQTFYEWKDTYVYLYFDSTHADNSTYVGAITTAVAQSVWDSGYKGVWSLVNDPTGGTDSILDSTSNVIHGTPYNFEPEDRVIMPGNGPAYNFNDRDTVIKLTAPASYFNFVCNSGLFTIESFTQLEEVNSWGETIIGNCYGTAGNGFVFWIHDYDLYAQHVIEWSGFKFDNPSVGRLNSGNGSVNDTDPHYLAVKSTDWSNRGIRFFVDEVNRGYYWELNDAELEGILGTEDATFDTYIGARGQGTSPFYSNVFHGRIAQVRISDIPRSDPWMIATSYDFRDEWVTFEITQPYSDMGRHSYGGDYVLSGHETMEKTKELGAGSFSLTGSEVTFFAKIDMPTFPLTAKSIIIDVENNHGNPDNVGLRHLEFYLEGSLVDVYFLDRDSIWDDVDGYGFYSSATHPVYLFGTGDTPGVNSLRLDGSPNNVCWLSRSSHQINGRVRITGVFSPSITFDQIIYYNYHSYGGYTDLGAKTVKINLSTSEITVSTDISDQPWDADWGEVFRRDYDISIPNSLLLFWGDLERHSSVDEPDGHNLALPGTVLASSGSLLITGSNVLLGINHTMIADTESYLVTGTEVDFISSTAGIGHYTYVGYDTAKRLYPAESGEYEITGMDVAQSHFLEADSGLYSLIGFSLNYADPGTYKFVESNTVLGISFPGLGGSYSMEFPKLNRLYCMPGVFTLEGSDQLSSIDLKRKSEGHPIFFFKLTGEENETTDLEMPIGLIQATLRSGRATYLRVWVPDITLASEITARKDGTMQIDMAYRLPNGAVTQRELIIEANLGDIRIKREADRGSGTSIYLTGHKQKTFIKKAITLYDPFFKQRKNGQLKQCSFPEPNLYINPGDRLIVDGEVLDIDLIRLTIQNENSKMEVCAA